MLVHDLMVGIYGGGNGHQLVPLMPSGLVKTIGKGLGICCLCIMVLALWYSMASAQLEKGGDLHRLTCKLKPALCKMHLLRWFLHGMVMLLMPSLVCLQVNAKALRGLHRLHLSIWDFFFTVMVSLLARLLASSHCRKFMSWKSLLGWGFDGTC